MWLSTDSHNNKARESKKAEGFIQSALDALSAHIAILDDRGIIIGVNEAWRKFAVDNKYPDNNFGIGTNYLGVCDAATMRKSKDAPLVARGIREIIAGHRDSFKLEYPCHSPFERRWFVVRVSRFDWYHDVRLVVAHQNVSDLKHTQMELGESKSRLEAILDNVNNGILTVNRQGMIESANVAAARIFDYGLDELKGMSLQNLIDEPFSIKNLHQHMNNEYGAELVAKRKDGSLFYIYFALNQLRLNGSNLYTCIIQDITYRKRMEAEIIERERVEVALEKERELRELKNRFLSMMGHELNTPLAAISLSHDMLKKYRDVATEEENEQALDNIKQQVEHLRDMVKDVITLSRSESDAFEIETEDVDLITYCRDVVEEFTFTYHRTHQVEFECDELNIRAEIDRRTLRRVFTNLLSNAIKYSPTGGRVLFRLDADFNSDMVKVQVSDSGIGIPKEDIPRLFEAFHRAGNVANITGTGLGLAIVKQIVDLHHGNIAVESQSDIGTTFTIHLPMHHMHASDN